MQEKFMRVASIGECMIEFSAAGDGLFARGFGSDTLNTALYLSRLGVDTSYVTALGDDALSEAMLVAWLAEGIATDEVLRLSGRVPGLYMIERDPRGERRFLFWRDRAPARAFAPGSCGVSIWRRRRWKTSRRCSAIPMQKLASPACGRPGFRKSRSNAAGSGCLVVTNE